MTSLTLAHMLTPENFDLTFENIFSSHGVEQAHVNWYMMLESTLSESMTTVQNINCFTICVCT